MSSNVPGIPGTSIETFTAVAGADSNLLTLGHKAIAVTKLVATETFNFNVTRVGPSLVDPISQKPSSGNYPLRSWYVDFGLTPTDQLTPTFEATLQDTLGTITVQEFDRLGTVIALPVNIVAVLGLRTMLGSFLWEYRIGEDVNVYAQGIEPSVPDGQQYTFVGTNRRRLALGDDFLLDQLGRVRVLTNLVAGSEILVDYDFAVRSSMTGW